MGMVSDRTIVTLLERFADTTDEYPITFDSFEQGVYWDELMQALDRRRPLINWPLISALLWCSVMWLGAIGGILLWLT